MEETININIYSTPGKASYTSFKAKKKTALTRTRLWDKKLSDKEKEAFYSEMNLLLDSGLDLKTSFELYLEGRKAKTIFSGIYSRIVEGGSLWESFLEINKFQKFEVYTLKVGEETGSLTDIFKELSDFYSRRIQQTKRLKGALSYPLMVLLTSIVVVFFMLRFVVPMFSDIFARYSVELPAITKGLLQLSDFCKTNMIAIFLTPLILLVCLKLLFNSIRIRSIADRFALYLPGINKFIISRDRCRFYQFMSIMISSGLPLSVSLGFVSDIVKSTVFSSFLKNTEKRMIEGISLYRILEESDFFPAKDILLLKLGEEVNKLDQVFKRQYNSLMESIDSQQKTLNVILEPFLIFIVGILVGGILIAMYMPMFQISSTMF